ncbi:MAG TPA: hypothetical protein VHV76_07610 [Mycobacteriales bacterium]|nr:hypothetical protein [Mycobacteriales bacterium]
MQPRVSDGRVLDGRYLLDEHCGTAGDRQLWHATDEVLGRRVAVHLVAGQTRTDAKALAAAAGRAGSVPDSRWVRVLDVGTETAGRKVDVWIVSEWIEGQSLAALLRREPLKDAVAVHLVATCAQAVAAAQRSGASHGSLHPGEVLLQADGSPRLTGLETHLALGAEQVYDDVRGLGALLFAAVTGHWPLPGWGGLPAVTRGDGRHPRQQRFAVSRAVDEVTARALDGGYPDAGAVARALDALPSAPLVARHDEAPSPSRDRLRRIAWWVVPPVLVAVVGVVSWSAGSDLGKVPGEDRGVSPSLPQSHGIGATRLVWTTPPAVTSFDPEGNGIEDPGGVGLAVDDDPSTVWTTDSYHGSARFGGLKNGVGLLIDLGRPRRVKAARLLLSAAGASFELRAGGQRPGQPSDLPVVATSTDSKASVTLPLPTAVTARYWLVWITSLPRTAPGNFALGIAEVALLH